MGENCGSHQHGGECCGGSSKHEHEMKEQKHGCGCESEKKDQKDSCCG